MKYFIKDIILHVALDAQLSLNIKLDNINSCQSKNKKVCFYLKIFNLFHEKPELLRIICGYCM